MRNISLLTIILLTAALAVAGQTFTLTGTGGQSVGGYYVFPYFGQVNNGPTITTMCNDFATEVGIPSTWDANVTSLASGDLANTKYGDLRGYEEAFWLFDQAKLNPSSVGAIQLAVWSIFAGSNPTLQALITDTGYGSQVTGWLDSANADAPVNLSAYVNDNIISPTPLGSGQEQLWETPEPSSLLLMGSGILGVMFVVRRRAISQ